MKDETVAALQRLDEIHAAVDVPAAAGSLRRATLDALDAPIARLASTPDGNGWIVTSENREDVAAFSAWLDHLQAVERAARAVVADPDAASLPSVRGLAHVLGEPDPWRTANPWFTSAGGA